MLNGIIISFILFLIFFIKEFFKTADEKQIKNLCIGLLLSIVSFVLLKLFEGIFEYAIYIYIVLVILIFSKYDFLSGK